MARAVFVKKARKDNPAVKAGESYWWWAFRFGGKHYSKIRPRPSQLTQSEFMSQMLALGEEIEDLSVDTVDDLISIREDIAERIRELGEEQSDRRENMPEGLQDGPTGELLENRYNESESMADELESIEISQEEFEESEMTLDEWLVSKIEELQNISYNGE